MKKFECEVTRTDKYIIELDENEINYALVNGSEPYYAKEQTNKGINIIIKREDQDWEVESKEV